MDLVCPIETVHVIGGYHGGYKMHESVVRVLIVDDFQERRQVIRGIISGLPRVEIAGEAADGLEAVEKAQQLQPDLILLDIGIPGLNGIEAARQIAKVCRKSKIAFLTENRCYQVVEDALQVGASGYILKSHFDSELVPGVAAMLKGKQFVSHAWYVRPQVKTPVPSTGGRLTLFREPQILRARNPDIRATQKRPTQ